MEAIACREYGSASDGAGEVLVRIHSAAVNPLDTQKLRAEPYLYQRPATGLRRPRKPVLGGDVAGRVEAVGSGVTRFQPGGEVYGSIRHGGFAQYPAASEDFLVHKPAHLSFDQAAALPVSGLTALTGLGGPQGVEPGQRVLVIGASGGVGRCAVQPAKAMGAEVTPIARRGPRDRLHEDGSHRDRPALRRDPSGGGEPMRHRHSDASPHRKARWSS
jgi:NADPH:quinone reductase-like Zn-dependent oxidoreductase